MKHLFLVILTFISFGANSQNLNFQKENSIPYIKYFIKNSDLDMDLDNFSEYYPLVHAYYFDGDINFNQTEKILFEACNDDQIIRRFPYKYSSIQIDSISNDTIVYFKINDKTHKIYPNQTYEDSIQKLVYQDILSKDRIFDNKNKNEKEIEFRIVAPTSAEISPKFESNGMDLKSYFNYYGLKQFHENNSSNAFIQIVLDENGNITYTKLYKGVESIEVTDRIIKAINEMPKWTPAKNGNKNSPITLLFELNEN